MNDAKARFDQLLATTDDRALLGELLDEELAELRGPFRIFASAPDVPRLALLAGATRDYGLWRRLVQYLTEEDAAHRFNQRMTGTPKEDLGPFASEERSAGWVASKARQVELPEVVRAPILAVLEEFEREFARRREAATDDAEEEPDNPWWHL
jgi:hypothetical protein